MDEHEEHEAIESHAGEGYFDVMSDPAHVMAEVTYEVFFFILSLIFLAWKLRRRDRKHGHVEGESHDHAVAHGQALHDEVERSMQRADVRHLLDVYIENGMVEPDDEEVIERLWQVVGEGD